MQQPHGIEMKGVGKDFDRRAVLNDIDLEARGGVLGLLGPNGAGKTTTVRILTTLARPDRGRATVAGFDVSQEPQRVRERIGVTGQATSVDALLTGRETLEMVGQLLHLGRGGARERASALLDRFDLAEAADRRVMTYSGGMRRRLDLAASIVRTPSVLFLDEPTTGLDPRGRLALWDAIRGLADAGTTILLTTQYLEEADRLADRVAVIDAGRLVVEGTPAELKSRVAGLRLDLVLPDDATYGRAVDRLNGRIVTADAGLRSVGIGTDGSGAAVRSVLSELEAVAIPVQSVAIRSASLDDVFFALTGRHTNIESKELSTHA